MQFNRFLDATNAEAPAPSNGMSVEGQAFLLVVAAGLCTAIGASVVFFPKLADLAKPHILCMALSFAAGIMIYISLVDIYGKSVGGFAEDFDEGDASIYACLSFFAGCFLMLILDKAVGALMVWDRKRAEKNESANLVHANIHASTTEGADIERMRDDFVEMVASEGNTNEELSEPEGGAVDPEKSTPANQGEETVAAEKCSADTTKGEHREELSHMGWAMAAAIAFHNFPEGMLTFLVYTQDNAVGVALAIGIAIHNIPEGLCVAMPLYYATGRRLYSFMWGTLSGLTEPLGALIVWGFLRNGLTGTANGILFGLVGGMMTVISIDELLPTAFKSAANPKSVTYGVLTGMFFIASSLMLFSA